MAPGQAERADGSRRWTQVNGNSKPEGPETWQMTKSMTAAYNAMRGSGNLAESKLVHWARNTRNREHDDGLEHEMLRHIDKLLAHEMVPAAERISEAGVAGRERRFSVQRPAYEHLSLLPSAASCSLYQRNDDEHADAAAEQLNGNEGVFGHRKSLRSLEEQIGGGLEPECLRELELYSGSDHATASRWTERYGISDDEGEPEDGRISPCTFRLWAAGASNVHQRDQEAKAGARAEAQAQSARPRSAGGEGDDGEGDDDEGQARDGFGRWHAHRRAVQEALTDIDPWVAAKVGLWQHHVRVTQSMRDCPGRRLGGAGPEPEHDDDDGPGQVVCVRERAVREALARPDAPTHLDGVPTQHIDEELRRRYQRAKEGACSMAVAMQEKYAAQQRIAVRSRQARCVEAAMGVLKRQQVRQREKRQRRQQREEIYRHVQEHLCDMEAKANETEYQADRHWADVDELLAVEDDVCERLRQMALAVGIDAFDPDEIEARVVEMSRRAKAEAADDVSDDVSDDGERDGPDPCSN